MGIRTVDAGCVNFLREKLQKCHKLPEGSAAERGKRGRVCVCVRVRESGKILNILEFSL